MSRIIYGDAVELKIVTLNMCTREVVYDDSGTDPLYTRWMFDVSALVSPEATSYKKGPTVYTPVEQRGVSVVDTDAAIYAVLMTPRLSLRYSLMSNTDLALAGEAAEQNLLDIKGLDAQNGPKPLRCNITKQTGNKVFHVDWAVEVALPFCTGSTAPVIMSNSYLMTQDLDPDYRMTRIVQGVAVFRTDLLASRHITPDSLRQELMAPVPLNFRRDSIVAELQPDGCTMNYSYEDHELAVTFNPNGTGATRIEATHSRSYQYPGLSSYYG